MIMSKRSLYQCYNAHVQGDKIVCIKGHKLGKDGVISSLCLVRGDALEYTICQKCPDYNSMGEALTKEERGWK